MIGSEMKKIKDGYKETEIGVLPEDWEVIKIEECTSKIVGGGTPSRSNPELYNGDIPWITVKDLNNKFYKDDAIEYITEEAIKRCSTNLIEENAVIIATRMGLGRGFINTKPVAINQDMKALILKDKIDTRYFLHWYLSKSQMIENLGTGTTVKGIRLETLKAFQLPLPPHPEQQRIAEILSATDEHIEKLDATIEDYQLLKKGMMRSLLTQGIGHTEFKDTEIGRIPKGWEVVELGNIADVKGGKRIPKGYALVDEDTGFPYIRVADMSKGSIDDSDLKYVPAEIEPSIKNYKISKNDLFISVAGTLGIVGSVPEQLNNANLTENANKICNIKCDKKYLKYYLQSQYIQNVISNVRTVGAQPKLAIARIQKFLICLPKMSEQSHIAEIISSIDDRIQLYEKENEDFTELKKGLIEQLLTGKTRVK